MLYRGLHTALFFNKSKFMLVHEINFPPPCRLEPVIIELERQRAPVVVISHQVYIHNNTNICCSLKICEIQTITFK